MYLILTDPTARTVRVEHDPSIPDNAQACYNEYLRLQALGIHCSYMEDSNEEAESRAKSIAIKENLIYTPVTEL
jgi:hypothetical protein